MKSTKTGGCVSAAALAVVWTLSCVDDRDVMVKEHPADSGPEAAAGNVGAGGARVGSGGATASGGNAVGGRGTGGGAGEARARMNDAAPGEMTDRATTGARLDGGAADAEAGTGGTDAASAGGKGGGGSVCTPMSKRCSNNAVQTCNAAGTMWGAGVACKNQACVTDACTGVCTPGTYRCTNNIGQRCGSMGNYVSNGSTNTCNCYVPGRFVSAGTNLVKDTTTGLVWESAMRNPATYPTASTTCDGIGMRLPTYAEWQSVLLLSIQNTTNCSLGAVPFDQAAMPTSTAELGGTSVANLWTGDAEPGFPGYVYVVFLGVSGNQWGTSKTDAATTTKIPYRCVK